MVLHRRQRSFGTPARIQASLDGGVVDPGSSGPLRDCEGLSERCDPPTVPTVAVLLGLVDPLAVLLTVVAVVVHALDGVLCRWAESHVRKEVLELHPPVAHFDATSAVVFEVLATSPSAPASHSHPGFVLRCMRASVSQMSFSGHTSASATTRLHLPPFQATSSDRCRFPAVAQTYPAGDRTVRHLFLYGKLTKALSL